MKRFKIVQHFTSDSDHMYRIFERECLFFWKWRTSFANIEHCESYILNRYAEEASAAQAKARIPKSTTVGYY
jgi:hypothetical protein